MSLPTITCTLSITTFSVSRMVWVVSRSPIKQFKRMLKNGKGRPILARKKT
jgi:hypothetical protein